MDYKYYYLDFNYLYNDRVAEKISPLIERLFIPGNYAEGIMVRGVINDHNNKYKILESHKKYNSIPMIGEKLSDDRVLDLISGYEYDCMNLLNQSKHDKLYINLAGPVPRKEVVDILSNLTDEDIQRYVAKVELIDKIMRDDYALSIQEQEEKELKENELEEKIQFLKRKFIKR